MPRVISLFVLCALCSSVGGDDYTLTIDGKPYELGLGGPVTITLPDGRTLQVMLQRKAQVRFRSKRFSFEHSSALTPTETELQEGLSQMVLTSARGTLVLVQDYTGVDPAEARDVVLKAMVEEELAAGFELTTVDAALTLADGTRLTGKRCTTSNGKKTVLREVFPYTVDGSGLLLVTQRDSDATPDDLAILQLFWKTIRLVK